MTVYVFVGPTLKADDVRAEIDAVCLAPVSQGDVYRVALKRPRAIGIIDGYFEQVPAVWHKEILWAMAGGVHVFGSASMGALRAAELARYGMKGTGEIFEAYRSGVLEDDDEVAVIHGPAELRYPGLSEAMVNIRATLAAAEAASVVPPELHQALLRIAKGLFYPQRTYTRILRLATLDKLDPEGVGRLEEWLPRGRIDQKRRDAVAMLRYMREYLSRHPGPLSVDFTFEPTRFWIRAMSETEEPDSDGTWEGPEGDFDIREALRIMMKPQVPGG